METAENRKIVIPRHTPANLKHERRKLQKAHPCELLQR